MTQNKTELQEAIDLMRKQPMTMTYQKTVIEAAQSYANVVHENEHLKACLKADNEIQNTIIKLAEPFMNIQNGKTYSAYHALDAVESIVKAYADLPEKIKQLPVKLDQKDSLYICKNDILNLLEIQND